MGFFSNKQPAIMDQREVLDRQDSSQRDATLLSNSTEARQEMVELEQLKQSEDLIKWQQNLGPDVDLMEHNLRQERFNLGTDRWERLKESWYDPTLNRVVLREMKPICNDVCIQMLKTSIAPFMSKNEMMSNYSTDQIIQKLKSTLKTLVRNLGLKYEFYELNFHDISMVRQMIQNMIMAGPFRALNQGEKNYIKGSSRRIETVNGDPSKGEKKSIWSLTRK